MERKISSSFTEFYKVFGVAYFIFALIFFGAGFGGFPNPLLFSLLLIFSFLIAFDFWKMKEVEMTEVGLIITNRFFFKQESVFVPFKDIEIIRNKFRWIGNYKRVTVKFIEPNKFGKEISFLSKPFTIFSQNEMVEELNRLVRKNKDAESLPSASSLLKLN